MEFENKLNFERRAYSNKLLHLKNQLDPKSWKLSSGILIHPKASYLPINLESQLIITSSHVKSRYGVQKMIEVSRSNYTLSIFDKSYDIALSDEKTPIGKFEVCEKWENPYWKSKTRLWLPGENNPIGKYLIILKNEGGDKLSNSIHQWVQWDYSDKNFKQGNFGEGCIRTNPREIRKIFNSINLGDIINIQN